jgi:hypothetical protein
VIRQLCDLGQLFFATFAVKDCEILSMKKKSINRKERKDHPAKFAKKPNQRSPAPLTLISSAIKLA